MGHVASKLESKEAERREREEALLGPPSKTLDATPYVQDLVRIVYKSVEDHLDLGILNTKDVKLESTEYIERVVRGGGKDPKDGTMYYVKVRTNVDKWPWVFAKIYEPPKVTTVSPVTLKGFRKMEEEYKLVTF
uniref:Uncharacterized protein n=1 Tax=Pseudictyota dubia TaxID=2749911 RepID=A0A6U2BUB8_9STRA|mmetsp:Transcript_21186/g.39616  ORF Transcript_21186/g.39616 Transcript_21186/m.39616 type:complete len:134 (+) Transcript_21186:188-589(+)|eukprot:CAMPEP_0197465756 /NCGR_PEP_ID=MMETSP1175-20131217/64701_1 /TAXON_ID=1003142 /ORGANISM="Triceratium dubium, Strain CCMP147" /LENGTH=133 /DNA_ID=CAMNT_0043001777 /DNA_START=186 /DNA_END=587 /DNA_ORIENTATION=+